MRLDIIGDNSFERVLARTNIGPWPLVHTQMAYTLARVVMAATHLGVLEELGGEPVSAAHVAAACGTDPHATEKLLFALAASGYARELGDGYVATARTSRWLKRTSPHSVADMVELQYIGWELVGRTEEFVRTGQPVDLHEALDTDGWRTYQRGMRALASALAPELALRLRAPRRARTMLDIGGSHGHLAAAICRRHRRLRAVVMDLPKAVAHAAPMLAAEGLGERLAHRAGDVLLDDLGSSAYDLILACQVVHHFTEEQNRELAVRVATALRPGGVYAIVEELRPTSARRAGQLGALLELYFALTSRSGTWTAGELAGWQRAAGLEPRRVKRLLTAPGVAIQAAVKPR